MRLITLLLVGLLAACSTSHSVMLADMAPHPAPKTAALTPQDGNSEKMDKFVIDELKANGLEVKPALPAGTRQSPDVDLVVAYVDHWFWDLVMYLRALEINVFDGKSGNLLVQAQWNDSKFHGFRDPAQVLHEVVPDMLSRLKTAPEQGQGAAPK
jgi:hypothetical protein